MPVDRIIEVKVDKVAPPPLQHAMRCGLHGPDARVAALSQVAVRFVPWLQACMLTHGFPQVIVKEVPILVEKVAPPPSFFLASEWSCT